MNFKKKILILFICILFLISFLPKKIFAEEKSCEDICKEKIYTVAPENGTKYYRQIGTGEGFAAGSKCSCCKKIENNKYECFCQQINHIEECQTGFLIVDPICSCCGDCTLNNFVALAVAFAGNLLKIMGIFALLFFVIGGVIWITSGGSSEKVEKGKSMIKGAIIGMIIIIAAFSLVRLVMQAIKTEDLLPTQESGGQSNQSWPECVVPPVVGKPWCYGCTWTGTNRGCQSNSVKIYQEELNTLGCNCGTADGMFGSQTKSCTIRFQKANNLTQDGLVGQSTYNAVFQSLNPNPCQ